MLPIGTLVLLKERTRQKMLMIVSHYPLTQEDSEVGYYDYGACLYPEGLVESGVNEYFFNGEDIDKIVSKGFVNNEEKEYEEKLLKVNKDQYIHFHLRKDERNDD